MACNYTEKLKDYLEENLSPKEMEIIDHHIENCSECQEKLDNLLNNFPQIPLDEIAVEDEVLIAKIKSRIKGIRRIAIYGVLGFILGLFSRFYTRDSFLITKAIMALPYKLSEFALGIFFSKNVSPWERIDFHGGIGLFPYQPILDFLAAIITPGIIALFIAIMIGYLVSDKRVFQRKKIINFLIGGLMVFLIWVGVLYGVYDHTLEKIENLAGISGITIYSVENGNTNWLFHLDENALSHEKFQGFIEYLEKSPKLSPSFYPQERTGYELWLEFTGGGRMRAFLDEEKNEMLLQNGNRYELNPNTLDRFHFIIGSEKND